MTSRLGKQTITMHILPDILRSQGNQTMKFGHLKEYNTRNTFPEKSFTNVVEKLFLENFLKNQN